MKKLQDDSLEGKIALLRLNLNVPIEKQTILDDFRIRAVLPTIQYCRKHAQKTVIIAHLGRPEGKDDQLSLKPVAEHLHKLLGQEVIFLPDCVGEEIRTRIAKSPEKSIILLENLRFHEEERQGAEAFGEELARNGDLFINDAFGDSYKAYASVIWPPKRLPAYAGLRLQEEIESLSHLRDNPDSPFCLIIGGAKIKEKMGTIMALGEKADSILLGGAVANTFLAAQGVQIGSSLYQKDEISLAESLLQKFKKKLFLPTDVGAGRIKQGKVTDFSYLALDEIGDQSILDIGPETFEVFASVISRSKAVFWAGPLGYIEDEQTKRHSLKLARLLAEEKGKDFVGGGETASLLTSEKLIEKIDFVSTGGGAALVYLSGEKLPGLVALDQGL